MASPSIAPSHLILGLAPTGSCKDTDQLITPEWGFADTRGDRQFVHWLALPSPSLHCLPAFYLLQPCPHTLTFWLSPPSISKINPHPRQETLKDTQGHLLAPPICKAGWKQILFALICPPVIMQEKETRLTEVNQAVLVTREARVADLGLNPGL